MSYSYIYQSAQKITLGWGDEAKETPFGGLTWSGHFSGVAAYEGALDRVAVLENELAGARVERDVKLVELGDLNRQAHYGLLGRVSRSGYFAKPNGSANSTAITTRPTKT